LKIPIYEFIVTYAKKRYISVSLLFKMTCVTANEYTPTIKDTMDFLASEGTKIRTSENIVDAFHPETFLQMDDFYASLGRDVASRLVKRVHPVDLHNFMFSYQIRKKFASKFSASSEMNIDKLLEPITNLDKFHPMDEVWWHSMYILTDENDSFSSNKCDKLRGKRVRSRAHFHNRQQLHAHMKHIMEDDLLNSLWFVAYIAPLYYLVEINVVTYDDLVSFFTTSWQEHQQKKLEKLANN
jgi:hypothetical protein